MTVIQEVRLRKAVKEDIPAIIDLCRSSIGEAYGSILAPETLAPWIEGDMIDTIVNAEWEKMIVAVAEGMLVGVVTIENDTVGLLWTNPAFRRRKIGSQLMNYSDNAMRENGVATARLECFSDNLRGLAFYRSLGWRTVRREMNEDAAVMQDVMEKTL